MWSINLNAPRGGPEASLLYGKPKKIQSSPRQICLRASYRTPTLKCPWAPLTFKWIRKRKTLMRKVWNSFEKTEVFVTEVSSFFFSSSRFFFKKAQKKFLLLRFLLSFSFSFSFMHIQKGDHFAKVILKVGIIWICRKADYWSWTTLHQKKYDAKRETRT